MIFVVEVMFAVLLDVYRSRRKGYKNLEDCDPVEVFKVVFENQVLQFAFLLVVLMMTQNTYYMSRLAMAYLVILNMVIVLGGRLVYRFVLKKRGNPDRHRRKLVALVYENDSEALHSHLKDLDIEYELSGILKLDEAYPRESVRTENDNIEKNRSELIRQIEKLGCSDAFVCIPNKPMNDTADYIRNDIVERLGKIGVNTYFGLSLDGIWITGKLIRDMGYYQAVYYSAMVKRCGVLGVNFAVSNVENAVLYVRSHLKSLIGKYICFCNVHTTVEASENEDYMRIQNGSALTFPDGQPIVNLIQKAGFVKAERIAGPDFMEAMFKSTMDGKVSHFFYGASEETIELLKQKLPARFPGMDIKGYYSPPYRELTPEEDEAVVDMLNSSGADLIWIGLGAPKQEKWMAAHQGQLSGVMLGVGAGFNFFAGNIKRAPVWIQKLGMEWLYRLFQDPKRLFMRYLVSNAKFIWKVFFTRK
nr:WecB/TagA/CpsF family glycosyltransferase [Butyrivibrio sp. WCD3002]